MSNDLKKHSITIHGHRTSISLEEDFWQSLKDEAKRDAIPLARLVAHIDSERTQNLSSALRLFVLHRLQERLKQHQQ